MEIVLLPFSLAFLISLYAGIYDLRTTEIPEDAPFLLVSLGLFLWFAYSLYTGDISYLLKSVSAGTMLSFIGYLLYKLGQWGDGDAALLGGIGFLLPFFPGYNFFPLCYLFLLFVVGAAYTMLYAFVVGILDKRARRRLKLSLPDILLKSFTISLLPACFIPVLAVCLGISTLIGSLIEFSLLAFGISFILVAFCYYARVVENTAFIKRVHVSKLKVGDVLYRSKTWRGLSKGEINALKRKKRFVLIKEGVRFGPVFPIALLISAWLKNWLIAIFPFLLFL